MNVDYNKYACDNCANRATPICLTCRCIQKPSGATTKPSYYVHSVEVTIQDDEAGDTTKEDVTMEKDLAVLILAHLAESAPIPIKTVMMYNKLTEAQDGA